MQRVHLAPAFLLHQQPWGDHGRIFELFSRDHGRLSVFAKGVRGAGAKLASILQPFNLLLVSWAGRGDAPRLTTAERDPAWQTGQQLPADRIMSAYYLSELLLALTVRHDPQPELFQGYAEAITGLRTSTTVERELRLFEKRMLDVIGYGVSDMESVDFDNAADVIRIRPVLRQALSSCLEGRSLKTRDVAKSLLQFGKVES
jgi:DNA repair protein RecO (recombination protein O)